MAKGAASLKFGLIERRIKPRGEPTVPPLTAEEQSDFEARARAIEEMPAPSTPPPAVEGDGETTPSDPLSAELITAGRHAYKAERQRRAALGAGSGYDLTRPELRVESPRSRQTEMPVWRAETRAPASTAPVPIPDLPGVSPSPPIDPTGPPMTPMARDIAGLPDIAGALRRRALTLRLLPDQHGLLAEVCRGYGCSFQSLVVGSLEAYLDELERGGAPSSVLAPSVASAADYLGRVGEIPAGGGDAANAHYFELAEGWRVAVWRDDSSPSDDSAEEYVPAEALGAAARDMRVSALLGEAADGLGDTMLRSMADTVDPKIRRLALTIRLDEDLHRRLQAARLRLSRTGQAILIEAIDAHLARH